MKTLFAVIAALVLGVTSAALAKAPAGAEAFAKKVAHANAFEIQTSQLARDRAQSEDVKAFAQRMIDDHTKAGEDFKAALKQANIAAPSDKLTFRQRFTLGKLRREKGKTFDAAYVRAQLKAHEDAVSLFRNYSQKGAASPLKDFASKTLPTLEDHLHQIQNISRKTGVASR